MKNRRGAVILPLATILASVALASTPRPFPYALSNGGVEGHEVFFKEHTENISSYYITIEEDDSVHRVVGYSPEIRVAADIVQDKERKQVFAAVDYDLDGDVDAMYRLKYAGIFRKIGLWFYVGNLENKVSSADDKRGAFFIQTKKYRVPEDEFIEHSESVQTDYESALRLLNCYPSQDLE